MALTAIAIVAAVGGTAYAAHAQAQRAKKQKELQKHEGVMAAHRDNVAVAGEDSESEQKAFEALMRNTKRANT